MEQKQVIRNSFITKRNMLSIEERQANSLMIAKKLFASKEYNDAEDILIYASYHSEVDTRNIFRTILPAGKRVFCPKVLEPGRMEFYQIRSISDILPGYKGIPEPLITHKVYKPLETSKTLMIMPAVSFDSNKHRLGYGGGFYDRYLERFPFINTVALAFECQKYEGIIPHENTDYNPQWIITENNIY